MCQPIAQGPPSAITSARTEAFGSAAKITASPISPTETIRNRRSHCAVFSPKSLAVDFTPINASSSVS